MNGLSSDKVLVSIVLPCRNEEASLPYCLTEAKRVIVENNLSAEIIVADSSTDRSPQIAREAGVVLVKHDKDGYGNAYLEGFKRAQGKYIFMADADGTYDFNELPRFLKELQNGADLVIGNRFAGKIESGAMPTSHRYLSRIIFAFLTKIFFGLKIGDIHSGERAISREALDRLDLRTTGMEFASEMMVKASKKNLIITELPINYARRQGESKLRTLPDGWRHLRFLLLYSPTLLFLLPGIFLVLISFITLPLFSLIGYQLIIFSVFAKTYAHVHLGEPAPWLEKIYRHLTIEKASLVGLIITGGGIIFWGSFGQLLILLGLQTIFSSFMLSILGIKNR
ncbi:MAG: glycosyltransferase family 2 protein [Candidatus Paceibacterota bacterium]|jgi:glycosyltransferase involved in cell wall biosynthesis